MNAVYIGILEPGSTSRMRAESLRKLTPSLNWEWVDTEPPMRESARPWRTLAFRYQLGKAVDRINSLIVGRIGNTRRDLVWVDKGVFLRPSTLRSVRRLTRRLVHFTPDTAFHANKSRHFESSIGLYDLAVTTKSFEVSEYHRRVGPEKTLLTTQGYDAEVHFPRAGDEKRRREAVFVGLAEPDRERCVGTLLEAGIRVRLAGKGWGRFLRRWREHPHLAFEGEEIFEDAYANLLSTCWVGLGLLSKRFPEMHTTRTFEIPACGAVLATEATLETKRFFRDNEALFFDDYADLAIKLDRLLSAKETGSLSEMATAGRRRAVADHRDYASILATILGDPRLAL
jgi:spore maturation protein CgeB